MFVFDTSAITALLDADPYVTIRWDLANNAEARVVVPVGVMLDVAAARPMAGGLWHQLLAPALLEVHAITDTIAIEIGGQPGPLGARHALWESEALGWPIVTAEPGLYPAGTPLLTF